MSRLGSRCAAAVFAVLFGAAQATLASGPPAGFPALANAVAVVPLKGHPGDSVVVFRQGREILGLVQQAGKNPRLLWSRKISGSETHLVSPAAGIFLLTAKDAQHKSMTLYAYRFTGSGVISALAFSPSGQVSADEGFRLGTTQFRSREFDNQHIGSVRYRLVKTYTLSARRYVLTRTIRVPDYPVALRPAPNALVRTKAGSLILLKLEIADTEAKRETGLMNRKYLDPDSGMIFVWGGPAHDSFWMENTYIPLTVAFLGEYGTVQEMQDMEALSTALHTPLDPYYYAIEANLGFFAANDIQVGDRFSLNLQPKPVAGKP